MSNVTNPPKQSYSGSQDNSSSAYKSYTSPLGNPQTRTYTPSAYTSSYQKDANPSTLDLKGGVYQPKDVVSGSSPSLNPSGGNIEVSIKGSIPLNAGVTQTGGVSGNYRPYTSSTDTTSRTTDNPSVLNASNTSQKPSYYNPAIIQPIYKELQQHIGGQPGKLVTGMSSTHNSGIDPPPNTNTYTSPLLKPQGSTNYQSNQPLLKLDAAGQDLNASRDPNRTYSYKKPQESYSSYTPTPSNIDSKDKSSKNYFAEARIGVTSNKQADESHGPEVSNGTKPLTTTEGNQGSPYQRSYTQTPSQTYGRDANRTLTTGSSYKPLEVDAQKQPLQQESNKNQGNPPIQNTSITTTSSYPIKQLNSKNPADQAASYSIKITEGRNQQQAPIFSNPLFSGETAGRTDFPEEYKVVVTEPAEPQRRLVGELAKSVVDIKYELPNWYEKDKDTELIENMYLIDAVRFTNRRIIHHSPARGSEKGLRASQMINAQYHSPSHYDNHRNISHKLQTPMSAKKWDRHLPRVILFVQKFNSSEMEDDDDEITTRDQEPTHPTPYYLESHQKVYQQNNRVSQAGSTNYMLRQQQQPSKIASNFSNGSFDVSQYQASSNMRGNLDDESDLGRFEEDEGIRQTIRVNIAVNRIYRR